MTRRLRVGVIGAGSWASAAHLPALARHRDEVEFIGVSRRGGEALARLQREYGFTVASEDYRDVLETGIDLAVVASPTSFHAEHAVAALEAGAHVLCEKPFTLSSDEAWHVADTAQRRQRHLVLSFGWNFKPMVRRMRALLAETGGIGTLEYLAITMSSQTRELLSNTGQYPDAHPDTAPEPPTWTDPTLSGGGYGQAQLSHALALGLGLAGARVTGAFALMTAPLGAPVELHDTISLTLEGGGIASVAGGSAYMGADGNRHHLAVEAIGSEGQLHLDVFRERAALYRADTGSHEIDVVPGDGSYDGCLPVEGLLDLVTGRTTVNPAPGELGARTVEALELAYRSAASRTFQQSPSKPAGGDHAR
ncbi:MAG: dehydrogenase [Actinomycetia bacterium]|nr:dehydrogenase [Actinomycetes bacterium]